MEKADYLVSADILSILICMIVPKLTSLLGLVSSIKITVKSAFLVEYLSWYCCRYVALYYLK